MGPRMDIVHIDHESAADVFQILFLVNGVDHFDEFAQVFPNVAQARIIEKFAAEGKHIARDHADLLHGEFVVAQAVVDGVQVHAQPADLCIGKEMVGEILIVCTRPAARTRVPVERMCMRMP